MIDQPHDPIESSQSPGLSPPLERGDWGPPAEPTSWPTVFGVIGIIMSCIGLLGGICGVGMAIWWPKYVDWVASMGTPQDQIDLMNASRPPMAWTAGSSVLSVCLVLVLLTGSIRLLKRRPSGVKRLLIWAWINIPWTVVGVLVGIMIQPQIPQTTQTQNPISPEMGAMIGMSCGPIFGLTLPIIMILWFSRAKIKEEIGTWSEYPAEVI